jgi:polyhydroxybutyrate depolymerase
MKYFKLLIFLFVFNSAKGQLILDSILIENHYRSFSYYKPTGNIVNGSLMFIMHGSGGNSNNMLQPASKLQTIASNEKLLVVYPNGYLHFWNECRKYSNAVANKEDINEQAFFTAMINYFQIKYSISKHKVFASGFSGGGQMAYKLALTMPGKFKAVTAVVANMPDSASCDCVLSGKPMPVMIINGTDDKTNPYNGGEMFVNNASFGVVLSSEKSLAYWATLAGYKGAPEKTLLPDTDPTDLKTIEKYSYHQKDKPSVTLLKIIGGHHDYPNDIDVYLYAWDFFKSVK